MFWVARAEWEWINTVGTIATELVAVRERDFVPTRDSTAGTGNVSPVTIIVNLSDEIHDPMIHICLWW